MWKNINQLIGRVSKVTDITLIKEGGEVIEQKQEIVETLNQYFSNVGPNLSNQIPISDIYLIAHYNPVFFLKNGKKLDCHQSIRMVIKKNVETIGLFLFCQLYQKSSRNLFIIN